MIIIPSVKIQPNTRSLAIFLYDEDQIATLSKLPLPSRVRTTLKKVKAHLPHEQLKVAIFPQASGSIDMIAVVSLGKKKEVSRFVLNRAIRAAARTLNDAKQKRTAFLFPSISLSDTDVLAMVTRESQTGLYAFTTYKKKKAGKNSLTRITVVLPRRIPQDAQVKKLIKDETALAEEINAARELSNMPGGDMTPAVLSEHAKKTGKKYGFRVTAYNEKQMKKFGMGGILGVSRGSDEPAKFIVCEYAHPKAREQKPFVFIGKGVTFDTGGLNVKPEMGMYEMHLDMSGGASVIHAVAAIARMKLPVHVVGLIPSAENMPSGSGYRPGDILRTYSGKTIEVKHTDAEGRLLLADALGFSKTFHPEVIVDLATLTGAAVVALGKRVSAVLSPDKKLADQLVAAGEVCGDRAWPLPLWPEYKSDMSSDFADIANISKVKFGGVITAAAFLWEFAPINHWAHVDIASTMTSIPEDHLSPGSKGSGVNLLVTFVKQFYDNSAKT